MNTILSVKLENGKYTVEQSDNGELYALRYGEPWRDLCGDNLVYSMASEIDRLRTQIQEATNCLVCAAIADPVEVCETTLSILDGENE